MPMTKEMEKRVREMAIEFVKKINHPEISPFTLDHDKVIYQAGAYSMYEILSAENEKLKEALSLIANPKRPDGTYNRCREACEQVAKEALS